MRLSKNLFLSVLAATALWVVPEEVSADTISFQSNNSNDDLIIPGLSFGQGPGPADPYPSTIAVTQNLGMGFVTGITVTDLNVFFDDVKHGYPDDLDILLVGPTGLRLLLMSDAGGARAIDIKDFRFDDSASDMVPDNPTTTDNWANQSWKPTNYESTVDIFPTPAPSGVSGSTLAMFNDVNPFGNWRLFVYDDSNSAGTADLGNLGMRDWKLEFTYTPLPPAQPVHEPTSFLLLGAGLAAVAATKSRDAGSK